MRCASPDTINCMSELETGADPSPARTHRDFDDPAYRAGVIDLLSVIAYGELSGAFATTQDASRAPALNDKISLAHMAVADFGNYERLAERIRELGATPEESMLPFRASLDEFHRRTQPGDWFEGLMKAYAGDAIASDFYAEIAQYVDADTRALVNATVDNSEQSTYARAVLAEAIEHDPRLGARLALWGRRLVGEALSQAQQVAAQHDSLTALLVDSGSGVGADLVELTRMFERLTQAHTVRMQALGLTA